MPRDSRSAVLFDLDGTMTDPFEGITRSIQYALEKLGRTAPVADDLRWCIGPPLVHGFKILLETEDEAEPNRAILLYRERYTTVGKFENRVIDGIPQALETLAESGHRLIVATSKPRSYTLDILDHFDLARHFDAVHGSELDGRNSEKTDLIRHIIQQEAVHPANAIMIGDRSHDIVGANANKVASIGVLWGYGDRAELEGAGAGRIAGRPEDLPALVEGMKTAIAG
jgi:phosphoglycolate phosphatase